jgi:hypothetical protein
VDRFFSIAGPTKAGIHYQIAPLTRLDWDDIQLFIKQQSYFVLHAPRQTGKTSTMLAMVDALNQSSEYVALYVNIEAAQAARSDAERGISIVCETIVDQASDQAITTNLKTIYATLPNTHTSGNTLGNLLAEWAKSNDKPCVLFLDEVDTLIGDTLLSLLRQIRGGYARRPNAFPQSIVMCGVRDVRDYRIHSEGEIITGGSAFNIKSASLRMGNFSKNEVKALYQQHTDETGQHFDEDIFDTLWQDTKGQPWLVNALAQQICWTTKENRDRNKTITLEDYKLARELLIYARTTHLDQLSDKLAESRVHAVIAPMLATDNPPGYTSASLDDLQYVEDLGLIQLKPQLRISNKIYQEVIPRELTYPLTVNISHEQAWYLTDDNRIDMVKLLRAFQQFFQENIDAWSESFDYKEAGPQLLMQAFLQRIVNGGGRISREYALGRKRTDLLIEWPVTDERFHGEIQRIVIELKILRRALETTIKKGLKQTAEYADTVGATEAHLVIFDRSKNVSWDEKIWQQQHSYQSRQIGVWGC